MKLSNALTAISFILLLSQTMQQPALAGYNDDPQGPTDPQEPNNPGLDAEKVGPVNPSFDPVGSGDRNPGEQWGRNSNGSDMPFDLQLGYQGLVLLDSCTGEGVITNNICGIQPDVASLPTE